MSFLRKIPLPFYQNRNNEGPPDLDEVFQDLKQRFDGFFSKVNKKSSGGNSGFSGGSDGNSSLPLIPLLSLGFILAIIIWASLSFYVINEQERGVVLRFGRYQDTLSPGLQWQPYFVDEVVKVNITSVRSFGAQGVMLSKDENIVQVNVSVQFNVGDAKSYVLNVRDPDNSLQQALESAIRHVVGSSSMNDVLTEGRAVIADEIRQRLQAYTNSYGSGLNIVKVNVEKTEAPSRVQEAFDDVIKAREDEQRFRNNAEAYANQIIPQARGQAQKLVEEAEAYKQEVINLASGEAERFSKLLVEYDKNPQITQQRLYIETIEKVLANTTKIITDNSTGESNGGNMMILPLDRILDASRGRGSNSLDGGTQKPQNVNTGPNSTNQRGRDLINNRRSTR